MAEQKACCRLITSTGQIEFVVPWVELVSVEIDRGGDNLNFDKKQRKSSEILLNPVEISLDLTRSLNKLAETCQIRWKTHQIWRDFTGSYGKLTRDLVRFHHILVGFQLGQFVWVMEEINSWTWLIGFKFWSCQSPLPPDQIGFN